MGEGAIVHKGVPKPDCSGHKHLLLCSSHLLRFVRRTQNNNLSLGRTRGTKWTRDKDPYTHAEYPVSEKGMSENVRKCQMYILLTRDLPHLCD